MEESRPFASTFSERGKTRAQLQNGRTLHRPLILLHPAAGYGASATRTSQISPAYVIVATSTTGLVQTLGVVSWVSLLPLREVR